MIAWVVQKTMWEHRENMIMVFDSEDVAYENAALIAIESMEDMIVESEIDYKNIRQAFSEKNYKKALKIFYTWYDGLELEDQKYTSQIFVDYYLVNFVP